MTAINKDVVLVVSLVLSVVSLVLLFGDLVLPVITGSTTTKSRVWQGTVVQVTGTNQCE